MELRVNIEEMTCHHCESAVEQGLRTLDGAENVTVNINRGDAVVRGNIDVGSIETCIEGMGYKFRGVESN